ncbi:cation:proton antiporter [Streptomyces sp. C184]|uniref:cation:proton antiporter domain-containing protein n=1 Tax=Streptomyces sp. C184 TaxID=3237121 RepID=UPI0034C60511
MRAKWRFFVAVAVVTVLPLVLMGLAAVRASTGGTPEASGSPPQGLDLTGHFFVSAAVVLAVAHVGGELARRLGQPPVIGEICAGLAMGPSLFGRTAPAAADWLFPKPVLSMLDGLSQLGLVLFMFGVGRELAGVRLQGAARQALLVSQASLLVPLAGGAVVALPLLDTFKGAQGNPLAFVMFLGCAVSITAFPVLARILLDLRLTHTVPGQVSLFAAAVGDAGGWLVLAAVLTLAHGSDPSRLLVNTLLAVAVTAVFLGPLRRTLSQWPDREVEEHGERFSATVTVLLAVGVTVASALTAAIGLHQLIGALLVGLAWPAGNRGAVAVADRMAGTVRTLLLPFFFFSFGLSTDLGVLRWDGTMLSTFAALLATAVVTKVAGPVLCAMVTGMRWRPALALGVLLNSRGLTELVVLQVGYQAGIIDQSLLGVLTIVALTTTMMTSPLLRCLGFGSTRAPTGTDNGTSGNTGSGFVATAKSSTKD